MTPQPQPDELDRALDAALRQFSAAEPDEDFEARLMASLRSASQRRLARAWFTWKLLVPALAAAVVLALLVWAPLRSTRPQPGSAATQPSPPSIAPPAVARVAPQPSRVTSVHHVHRVASGQRHAPVRGLLASRQTPGATTVRPNAQERLLRVYLAVAGARQALEVQRRNLQPLTIEPLQITKIHVESLVPNGPAALAQDQ